MAYEPDTIWGRTIAGDGEVAAPRSGLSLTQRRLLKVLAQPRTFSALAAANQLPPPKLEHELVHLAELQLVAFQRPGAPRPRTAPGVRLPMPASVTKNRARKPWPLLPWCFLATALGFAAVLLLAS
jgi:hypothetical protein